MRTIKFRGQREVTKEWVYGSLIEDKWNECSSGIHFFISKEVAKQYN